MKRKSATAAAAKGKKKAAKGKAAKVKAAHTPAHPGHHHPAHHPAHHGAHHPAGGKPGGAAGGGSVHGGKGKPPAKRVQSAHRAAAAHKRRALALPGDVACCAAEAVAASLVLVNPALSSAVDAVAVLELHRAAGGDDDAGASILAVLQAAGKHGLAGASLLDALTCADTEAGLCFCWSQDWPTPVLLGLELPEGPHAVLATADGWWSWGGLYDPAAFPGAVVEEAWAVTWA